MAGRLLNKVVAVTGAAQGIGEAIARACAAEGAALLLLDLQLEKLEALCATLAGGGDGGGCNALALRLDVSDSVAVEAAVQRGLAHFGRIDVLVNNAGVNVFCDPLAMTDADWQRCFGVDLNGAWHAARAVLPGMLAQGGGSIINIASTHSFSIIPGCFPYPVAKHGLLGLTRALGIEYAARGVRVNAIAPGYIETQLALDYWAAQPDPVASRARINALHPPGRIGRPEEVAMTAVFLASDEAPFINATCINIDGGRSVVYHE